ncbi:MAG: hypothetical protein MUC51_09685 [Anaerolineae bacterium]|jgi:hypothetical protein|nr:hypothetical protein [Anaerolineae bacterium]
MKREREIGESVTTTNQPPFLYEIRVKGRLSGEQWASWFDDLTVSFARGESTLRGIAPDHAALYGLLARLRDLAIPLVAVRVLDAEAQHKLAQTSRRYDLMINGLLVALYLLLLGGLVTITVFVAPVINVALALTLLFALLGALAHAFWLWSGHRAWRWVSYALWPAAAFTLLIFIPISGLIPPALGIAVMLLLLASGLLYALYFLRRHADDIKSGLAGGSYRLGWSRNRTAKAELADNDRPSDAAEQEVPPKN